MANARTLVSFDWALKRLLRQKANFGILEGFLSELLREDVRVKAILESESNADGEGSKINRVDMMVEDTANRLMLVELQYNHELDYFHRMLFATSKAHVEHLPSGYNYGKARKVISINLLYFQLGQGEDYVYHGTTRFRGIHKGDELQLSDAQRERFFLEGVHEIYPEYYIIKINNFDDVARDTLDEWIYFLKHTEVPGHFRAKGLAEVREKLRYERLSTKERKAYDRHQVELVSERNIIETATEEGMAKGLEEGMAKGLEEGMAKGMAKGLEEGKKAQALDIARQMRQEGLNDELILRLTGLAPEELAALDDSAAFGK